MRSDHPRLNPPPSSRNDSIGESLDVYLHNRRVGLLSSTPEGLHFQYAEEVIAEQTRNRWAISVRLPVRPRPYDHLATRAFFDNLLPQSTTLGLIARSTRYETSDTAGLLAVIGGECAGAVSLWPRAHPPPTPARYRPCSPRELNECFDETRPTSMVDACVRGRQSTSGVQPKLVFALAPDGGYLLPQHGSPTTLLLKAGSSKYRDLVKNEFAALALMEAAGVQTVHGTVARLGGSVLESPRYDRVQDEEGRIRRIHQEDFCQATGRQSLEKYSELGGITVEEIALAIRRHSATASADLELFVRWVFANLCIGNEDGHAKNIAFVYTPSGPRLAPAYDVVCTEIYPDLPRTLPLFIGAAQTADAVNMRAIKAFSRDVALDEQAVIRVATDVADRLRERARDVVATAARAVGGNETLERIGSIVAKRVDGLQQALSRPA